MAVLPSFISLVHWLSKRAILRGASQGGKFAWRMPDARAGRADDLPPIVTLSTTSGEITTTAMGAIETVSEMVKVFMSI
jgi:hypothetical protein